MTTHDTTLHESAPKEPRVDSQERIDELERRIERLERERVALVERAEAETARAAAEAVRLEELAELLRERDAEIAAMHRTWTMRIMRIPRGVYSRIRRRAGR